LPFHLVADDRDLTDALRRIARSELDAALARLAEAETPSPTAVHEVRKHVKKLRGLFRLVRPGFAAFRAETAALRGAAQSLSGLRDAEVRLATFDRLVARDRPEHLGGLRQRLAAARDTAAAAPAPAKDARAALADLRVRADHWALDGRDRDVLMAGLAATRKQARAAMRVAVESREMEALHDWRKRVKDGWYQARLLTPVWPAVLGPLADQAGLLGEELGEHHDLGVLAEALSSLPDAEVAADARSEAVALARQAMTALEARMFPLGALILAGKPKTVARLWVSWWQAWRDAPTAP
jgi:CHAD domain-containing protein